MIDVWPEPYRRMWLAGLDRLERHLDSIAAAEAAEDPDDRGKH